MVKNPPANVGDAGLNCGSGGPPEEGNGNPLRYYAWEIPWKKSLVACSPWGHERDRQCIGINNRRWARDRHCRLELRTHVFMPRKGPS